METTLTNKEPKRDEKWVKDTGTDLDPREYIYLDEEGWKLHDELQELKEHYQQLANAMERYRWRLNHATNLEVIKNDIRNHIKHFELFYPKPKFL
jgi:hypothetical protein